jgi:hypothetical protein
MKHDKERKGVDKMGDFQSLKEIFEARQREKQEEPKQVVETPKTKREKLFFKLKERVNELDKEKIKKLFVEKVAEDKVIRKKTKIEDKEVDLYIFNIYKENGFEVEIDLVEPDVLTFLADIFIFDNLNNKVFIRRIR